MTESFFPSALYPFNLIRELFNPHAYNLNDVYITGVLDAIERLPKENQTYIELRYKEGLPRRVCAEKLAVTPYEIEKLERDTLHRLIQYRNKGLMTATSIAAFNQQKQAINELNREVEALNLLVSRLQAGDVTLKALKKANQKEKPMPIHTVKQLKTDIDVLNLSVRARNMLRRNGWNTIQDITAHTRKELSLLNGAGPKITLEIDQALAKIGRNFKPEDRDALINVVYNPELAGCGFNPDERKPKIKTKRNVVYNDNPASNDYPNNLIRAIYSESEQDTTHTSRVNQHGLYQALETITDREKKVLQLKYQKGFTFEQISKIFSIRKEKAQMIALKALKKLREPNRSKIFNNK